MSDKVKEWSEYFSYHCHLPAGAIQDLFEEFERQSAENERQKRINTTHLEEHQRLVVENERLESVLAELKSALGLDAPVSTVPAPSKFTENVKKCIGNDPLCPCQDGLMCHYEGPDPWPIPEPKRDIGEEIIEGLTSIREHTQKSGDSTQNGNKDTSHRHITTGDVRKSLECTHPERTIAGGWTQCDVCGDKWQ